MSEKAKKEQEAITERFPWVTHKEFIEHYATSLASYLDSTYPPLGSRKTHITDLSASSASFSDAWWAIFQESDYFKD
jgi:hypothetical protein